MTTLDLPLLRRQLHRVLLVMEDRYGASIELNAETYWLLETSEMFFLDSIPNSNVGQLSDDVGELNAMALRTDDDLVPWHDLKHLIGILEALVKRDLP